MRWLSSSFGKVRSYTTVRPIIEPSTEVASCGYVCINAVMTVAGRRIPLDEVKRVAGYTSRGLTIRQVRDTLRKFGATADVVFFDKGRTESFPCNGIVLLSEGHYIVTCRHRRSKIEIFDPQLGWMWVSRHRLARRCNGLAVNITGWAAEEQVSRALISKASQNQAEQTVWQLVRAGAGRRPLIVFSFGQMLALTIPLLSMWSVNQTLSDVRVGPYGAIAAAFAIITITNILVTLFGDLSLLRTRRIVAISLSKLIYNHLAEKPTQWFESSTASGLHHRISAFSFILDYYVELTRSLGVAVVTFLVGVAVLFWISPWLILPGIVSIGLSTLIDFVFERKQRGHVALVVEAEQRRQSFAMDSLSQLPNIRRFGATAAAKSRFVSMNRSAELAQARMKSLKGWQSALRTLVKTADTLIFLTLAALFMGKGSYSIGGFVALGAYKDLLATSLASLFTLHMERKSLEIHKLQAAAVLSGGITPKVKDAIVTQGAVRLTDVCYEYGDLDKKVLYNVSMDICSGECVAIRGPSGSGKSTIAKIVTGSLTPTSGHVSIDGGSVTEPLGGCSAVFQSDKLIQASIRENILFFRTGFDDRQVLDALESAGLSDFIQSLPMGLATQIGEAIAGLSGGQRQRILIARAILNKPRVLVLDEATSSLELNIEEAILSSIRSTGATLLLIAHRPEVWRYADRIYDMNLDGSLTVSQNKADICYGVRTAFAQH